MAWTTEQTFFVTGIEFKVEITHQPPIPNADNPDDLHGYTEFEIIDAIDIDDEIFDTVHIKNRFPLTYKHLSEKVKAFVQEQMSHGVQAVD